MPPETSSLAIPNDSSDLLKKVPEQWHKPLLLLALSWGASILLAAREWAEMLNQWWNIDTYSHILLVPVVVVWLIWLRIDDLRKIDPMPWSPGLILIAGALILWLIGRISDINLIAHAGAVGLLQAVTVTMLGLRLSLALALPIAFAAFLVPFGDEMIPGLQMITADIAIALTRWSGIPAVVDGIYIDTPVGLFIVAEACSGVKFLIAMVTLAALVCFTRFDSWAKRGLFLLASIIVPILANGVRAWGTIYIAQSQGVEFAAGFDHIFYGWIFFAIVVALLLGGAWSFFEREPEDYGWSLESIQQWPWLAKMEVRQAKTTAIAGALSVMIVAAAFVAAIAAPAASS